MSISPENSFHISDSGRWFQLKEKSGDVTAENLSLRLHFKLVGLSVSTKNKSETILQFLFFIRIEKGQKFYDKTVIDD
jgi:hypothetical protein